MINVITINELAGAIKVSRARIEHAEKTGRLPVPQRWNGRKVYDRAAADRVAEYFSGLQPWHVK